MTGGMRRSDVRAGVRLTLGRPSSLLRYLGLGLAAGAAGTTALNTVTYLDMTLRGRPSSSTPEQTVERLSEKAHLPVPGVGETRQSRVSGIGALTGIATGLSVGAVYGIARHLGWHPGLAFASAVTSVVVMAGTNSAMFATGVTDPRTWDASSWVSDIVPHVAYGVVTAATFESAADDGTGVALRWP